MDMRMSKILHCQQFNLPSCLLQLLGVFRLCNRHLILPPRCRQQHPPLLCLLSLQAPRPLLCRHLCFNQHFSRRCFQVVSQVLRFLLLNRFHSPHTLPRVSQPRNRARCRQLQFFHLLMYPPLLHLAIPHQIRVVLLPYSILPYFLLLIRPFHLLLSPLLFLRVNQPCYLLSFPLIFLRVIQPFHLLLNPRISPR